MGDDYYGGDYWQDVLESALLELGGPELLADAHDEAAAYVDREHSRDGQGHEPAERVRVRVLRCALAAGRTGGRRRNHTEPCF